MTDQTERPQPAHVFTVQEMISLGRNPGEMGLRFLGVARSLTAAKAHADKCLARVQHLSASEWAARGIGLWGDASWSRLVDWGEGLIGWQQINVTYFSGEDNG